MSNEIKEMIYVVRTEKVCADLYRLIVQIGQTSMLRLYAHEPTEREIKRALCRILERR